MSYDILYLWGYSVSYSAGMVVIPIALLSAITNCDEQCDEQEVLQELIKLCSSITQQAMRAATELYTMKNIVANIKIVHDNDNTASSHCTV